jgi:hypothetical protein
MVFSMTTAICQPTVYHGLWTPKNDIPTLSRCASVIRPLRMLQREPGFHFMLQPMLGF